MNSEDAHTLVGAYVLDAVDDIERAAVERHLTECAACAAEVIELRSTAARLGEAAAAVPPPALRDKVLGEVRRTRQVAPNPRHAQAESVPPVAVVPRRRMWLVAAMAAAVMAVAVGGTTYVVQQQTIKSEREQFAAEQARAAQWQAVLSAPDARVVTKDVMGGGRVSIVVSERRNEAAIMMADLPSINSSQAYQLWLIKDGHSAPSEVMAAGQSSAHQLLSDVGSADSIGLTLEPASGSQVPTLPVLAVAPLR